MAERKSVSVVPCLSVGRGDKDLPASKGAGLTAVVIKDNGKRLIRFANRRLQASQRQRKKLPVSVLSALEA